jgi:hypothetical protein
MFVAGRIINVDGKPRGIGRPVPEAIAWPPHIRNSLLRIGHLLQVDDVEGEKLNRQADDRLALIGKNEHETNQIRLKQRISQIDSELSLIRSRESSLQFELEKCNLDLADLNKITIPPRIVPIVEEVVHAPPQQISQQNNKNNIGIVYSDKPKNILVPDVISKPNVPAGEAADREITRELQTPEIKNKEPVRAKTRRKRTR